MYVSCLMYKLMYDCICTYVWIYRCINMCIPSSWYPDITLHCMHLSCGCSGSCKLNVVVIVIIVCSCWWWCCCYCCFDYHEQPTHPPRRMVHGGVHKHYLFILFIFTITCISIRDNQKKWVNTSRKSVLSDCCHSVCVCVWFLFILFILLFFWNLIFFFYFHFSCVNWFFSI